MEKTILFIAIFSLSVFVISCQKSNPPSVGDIETSVYPVSFITVEHATDSGTVTNVSVSSKTGYTAIIQQNYSKDSSAIDSIKFRYEDVTGKYFPTNSMTVDSTNNKLVDSLILTAPEAIAVERNSSYPALVSQYYNFTIDQDSLFISGKTYTVIGTVYTANGNSETATFASLFKW
jgi:hypothetical protein